MIKFTRSDYYLTIICWAIIGICYCTVELRKLPTKHALPDSTTWPCITGKGYEAIIGHGPGRMFRDGVEVDVKETQKQIGCEDLDGVVGGETGRKMKDLNNLEAYNIAPEKLTPEELREVFK